MAGFLSQTQGAGLASSLQEHTAATTPVIPTLLPIPPSSGFVRNLSPEDDAYANRIAQEICARFVLQNSQQMASVSDVSSRNTKPDKDKEARDHADKASIFTFTITVRPNPPNGVDRCCRIETVTNSLMSYVRKAAEGVLVQSIDGECLKLHGALRFRAPHVGKNLQKTLRVHQVLSCFKDRPDSVVVKCCVTARCNEEQTNYNIAGVRVDLRD